MRRFVDLHLRPPDETARIKAMLELAAKLGFKGVGLVLEGSDPRHLQDLASEIGVDLVSRCNLTPRNANELTAALRRLRRRFEVVAVECRNKKVARQAAKDHRVDILNFPSSLSMRGRNRFDRQEASLASGANCSYEINVSDLLETKEESRSRLFALMRTEIENAKRFDVPIVVSSGASSSLQMRDPRGLAAVATLTGLLMEEGLDTASMVPWGIVEENRKKLDPGFVSPGVRRA